MKKRLAIFSTHPIQYYTPLYRELAGRPDIDLHVYYSFNNSLSNQSQAGFGVEFEWDIPLFDGYQSTFLKNRSTRPSSQHYRGCDTPEVASLIEKERFDAAMVHGWYTKSYRQTIKACRSSATPVFVRGDSTLMSNRHWLKDIVKQFTHRRLISLFDAYLVVGQRSREYYLHYGADPQKMVASPHFVDNQFFEERSLAAEHSREFRTKYQIPDDTIVFLFCGKFVPIKRPLDFIEAFAKVKNVHGNVAGLMVGDGPLRGPIETAIQQYRLPIYLTGFCNQSIIPRLYANSDVLVLPSESETWGLVVNESMACARSAIVSSQVGCSPDLIVPGRTGYEFPKGNVDELANRMMEYAADPSRSRTMGLQAREHLQRFSARTAADGICEAVARFGKKY